MASSDLDYNVDDAASYTDHDREAASDAGSPESSPVQKRSCPDNEAATLTFMDTHKLLDTIRSTTDVLECIPPGSKNNVCFVTRLRTDDHSGQAVYADDCGVWNAKSSTTICTTYAVVSGRLVYVTLHNGKYCTGGRKGVWIPLQPQPSPTNIVRAHRHYATLKADTSYRKRVTWFWNVPNCEKVAVVEYQGIHPGRNQTHGNARHISRPFVRTHPETLQRVDEKVEHRPPRDVCESMVRDDSVNAPRDLQQVSILCSSVISLK